MRKLDFAIIDPHIHQWDPYHTPHSAALLVKALGNYPRVMNKVIRVVKPKPLLDTLGLTKYALVLISLKIIMKIWDIIGLKA